MSLKLLKSHSHVEPFCFEREIDLDIYGKWKNLLIVQYEVVSRFPYKFDQERAASI